MAVDKPKGGNWIPALAIAAFAFWLGYTCHGISGTDRTSESRFSIEPAAVSQPEEPSAQFNPISLSGTGTTATQPFGLPRGLRRFTFTHSGSTNFIVSGMDELGNDALGSMGFGGLMVNEIGTYSGSMAIKVERAENYLLNIQADGPWTVKIE